MPASEQKVNDGRYALIPRTLIFLTSGENILLIKGAPNKRLWANRYNGVGGHVERGEDFLSAARRELYEETGLTDLPLWLCGFITIDAGENTGVGIFVLRGEVSAPSDPPRPSPEGSLEWVPLERLGSLPLVEDLPQLLPRVLGSRPGSPPFSAHYWYAESGEMQIRFFP